MGFDEARMSKPGLKRAQDRIESFHVTDLQDQFSLRGKRGQFACLRRIFRNRFFDEQMFSLFEQSTPDRVM